ncbi:Hypothetical protein CINCED_3A016906 [Cinara cedri]|uniref:Uncharacterized protein n=1 Tax=Cinara cedri TaxID=506608 RepID=A0A5E4N845_9HEMI|nr:Hypothetical protein CINCED_3A016906 [Cinara cedri]
MNNYEIAVSISHKEWGNAVGVLQQHDEDEVNNAKERIPVTRNEVLDVINTLISTVEEHGTGPDYFAILNNLEHTGFIPKKKKKKKKQQVRITDFLERTQNVLFRAAVYDGDQTDSRANVITVYK